MPQKISQNRSGTGLAYWLHESLITPFCARFLYHIKKRKDMSFSVKNSRCIGMRLLIGCVVRVQVLAALTCVMESHWNAGMRAQANAVRSSIHAQTLAVFVDCDPDVTGHRPARSSSPLCAPLSSARPGLRHTSSPVDWPFVRPQSV